MIFGTIQNRIRQVTWDRGYETNFDGLTKIKKTRNGVGKEN